MSEEVIISILCTVIGSGFLNGFVSHILYSKKLKKEQKMKFENMIGEKIAAALLQTRKITSQLDTIEFWNITQLPTNQMLDAFDRNTIYPAIMNDFSSLIEFYDLIQKCRDESQKFLDCETALNILFIDRYIMQLILFVKQVNNMDLLPALGAIFIVDLQKWQRRCDKLLIRKLNSSKCKIEYQGGIKWKILRKWIFERNWKNTILYHIINDETAPNDKKINMARMLLNDILMNPDQYSHSKKSSENV